MAGVLDWSHHLDDPCQPLILLTQILNRRGIHIECNHVRHEITSSLLLYRLHNVLQGAVHSHADFQKYVCGDICPFA